MPETTNQEMSSDVCIYTPLSNKPPQTTFSDKTALVTGAPSLERNENEDNRQIVGSHYGRIEWLRRGIRPSICRERPSAGPGGTPAGPAANARRENTPAAP